MSVLERLNKMSDFTLADQELATYLLAHADEVKDLRIDELAKRTCKSNSTIIRLCRKVGTKGWRDFRVQLASDLARRRREESGVDPNVPFQESESAAQVMSRIFTLQREALEDCYANVDIAQVEALAQAVHEAERIILYARGDSYAATIGFGTLLSKIGIFCIDADQFRLTTSSAFHATPRDLALFVTYGGGSIKRYEESLLLLRSKGCQLGIVTSYEQVAQRLSGFKYPVIIPHRENRYGKVASFYSQTCIRYVLNCVYSLVFSRNYDQNLEQKEIIERFEPGLVL